jgi:hypothetical protein
MVEYDDSPQGRGQIVPGSEKEVDLEENVVLVAGLNPNTYKQSDWCIFGTVPNTTLADYETNLALMEQLEQEGLEKYKT